MKGNRSRGGNGGGAGKKCSKAKGNNGTVVSLGDENTYLARGSEGDNNTKLTSGDNRDGYQDDPNDSNGGWYAMEGDLPGYVLTPEDLRMRKVYGDWVHANDGNHLDGGIVDDGVWKTQ